MRISKKEKFLNRDEGIANLEELEEVLRETKELDTVWSKQEKQSITLKFGWVVLLGQSISLFHRYYIHSEILKM